MNARRKAEEELRSQELHITAKTMQVPISKLKVDRSYQRVPNQELIDEIAENWNPIKAEIILVADRGLRDADSDVDGGLFVVSGQHRVRAAHKLGLKTIEAKVIDLTRELDPAALEADYRIGANRRVSDQAIDTFKAKIRKGDEDALAIVALLKRHHTQINFDNPGEHETGVHAIACLELLYRRDQGSTLNETLELIRASWGEVNPTTATANLLKGLAWFINAHGLEADNRRLAEKLQAIRSVQLLSQARQLQSIQGKSLWMNVYMSVVGIYNDKLIERNKLQVNLKGATRLKSQSEEKGDRRSRGNHL